MIDFSVQFNVIAFAVVAAVAGIYFFGNVILLARMNKRGASFPSVAFFLFGLIFLLVSFALSAIALIARFKLFGTSVSVSDSNLIISGSGSGFTVPFIGRFMQSVFDALMMECFVYGVFVLTLLCVIVCPVKWRRRSGDVLEPVKRHGDGDGYVTVESGAFSGAQQLREESVTAAPVIVSEPQPEEKTEEIIREIREPQEYHEPDSAPEEEFVSEESDNEIEDDVPIAEKKEPVIEPELEDEEEQEDDEPFTVVDEVEEETDNEEEILPDIILDDESDEVEEEQSDENETSDDIIFDDDVDELPEPDIEEQSDEDEEQADEIEEQSKTESEEQADEIEEMTESESEEQFDPGIEELYDEVEEQPEPETEEQFVQPSEEQPVEVTEPVLEEEAEAEPEENETELEDKKEGPEETVVPIEEEKKPERVYEFEGMDINPQTIEKREHRTSVMPHEAKTIERKTVLGKGRRRVITSRASEIFEEYIESKEEPERKRIEATIDKITVSDADRK